MARRSISRFGMLLAGLLVVGLVALAIVLVRPAKSVFTVSRETTYLTEPLMEDGWPDYIRVANERLSKGVTPENNAAVLLCQASGPASYLDRTLPTRFFKSLGMERPDRGGDYFVDLDTYVGQQDTPA